MIPIKFRPKGFNTLDRESWDDYSKRFCLSLDSAVGQFFRQVVYDHYEHHNNHYPNFKLDDFEYTLQAFTVKQIKQDLRFFDDEVMNWWHLQFDAVHSGEESELQDYTIYREMSQNHTPPFPPIIAENVGIQQTTKRKCGSPLHLIEGTHRTSYLLRMAELGIISQTSKHDFVLLSSRARKN